MQNVVFGAAAAAISTFSTLTVENVDRRAANRAISTLCTQNVDPRDVPAAMSTLCAVTAQNLDPTRRPADDVDVLRRDTNADSASPRGGRAALMS